MYDSTINCDEIMGWYDEKTNLQEKRETCKIRNFYILIVFLLITVASLIAVSI